MPNEIPPEDRLTIRRLLLLVAGVLIGFRVFVDPHEADTESFAHLARAYATASMIGLTFVGPFILLSNLRRYRPFGSGRLLWFTLGVGTWLLLPPGVVVLLTGKREATLSMTCMMYSLPLVSLWFLLAAAVGGRFTSKQLGRSAPWTERFGLYLGIAWLPLALWSLWDIYSDDLAISLPYPKAVPASAAALVPLDYSARRRLGRTPSCRTITAHLALARRRPRGRGRNRSGPTLAHSVRPSPAVNFPHRAAYLPRRRLWPPCRRS